MVECHKKGMGFLKNKKGKLIFWLFFDTFNMTIVIPQLMSSQNLVG